MPLRGRAVDIAGRRVPSGLGAGAVVAFLSLALGVFVVNRDGHPSSFLPTPARTPDISGQSGSVRLQQPRPDDLPEASEQPSGFVSPTGPATTGGDRTIVVFGLFNKGRMVAVTMDSLLHSIASPDPRGYFPANAASPVTGAAIVTARVGDAVVVAATNQAQLVRLTRDFHQRDTLTVSDAIGSGDAILKYGSLVAIGGDDLAVTLAFDDKIAVLRVNVRTWRIVASKVYDDRFAGGPQACLRSDGLLAVVSTGHVDYLDPLTLERRRTATLDGTPSGAACLGRTVVVTNFDRGSGYLLDGTARVTGTFRYHGNGTSQVIAAPSLGAVFLTEPVDGTVTRCAIPSGRCVTSGRIGEKPTDLVLVGTRLVVTLESDRRLAVLDARTLDLIGTAEVPDMPRTLLAFRP